MEIKKYKTICISDTHLGARDSKADLLNNFLKHHTCDNLFLIGDIIDGWKIQHSLLSARSRRGITTRLLDFLS